MNDKLTKVLRRAAGYRNRTATPCPLKFPGIARMVRHPVYSTRVTRKSTYMRLPMGEAATKVFTRVTHMVVDRWGDPIVVIETHLPGTLPVAFDATNKPTEYNKFTVVKPKEQLVPVTKAARHEPGSTRGKYRALKRIARRGLLTELSIALDNAAKEVPA